MKDNHITPQSAPVPMFAFQRLEARSMPTFKGEPEEQDDLARQFTWPVSFSLDTESLWPRADWVSGQFLEVNIFEFLYGLRNSLRAIRYGGPDTMVAIECPEWGHSTWVYILSTTEISVSSEAHWRRADRTAFLQKANSFKTEICEWILSHVPSARNEVGRVQWIRDIFDSALTESW